MRLNAHSKREGHSNTASGSSIYPSAEEAASGVYSLLSYGRVVANHPEHPDAFIPELLRKEWTGKHGRSTAPRKEHDPAIRHSDSPPLLRSLGGWSTGFGTALEDVYRDRGALAPRFTTKSRCVYTRRRLAYGTGDDAAPRGGGTLAICL